MPNKGYKQTKEHKSNLSLSLKGRNAWNKGLNKENSIVLKKQGIEHSKKMKGRKGNRNSIDAMANKNRGNKRTDEIREKISKSHKGIKKPWISEYNSKRVGEKHPNWQGGKTPEYASRFNKIIWKNIRKLVLYRDNYTCNKCGIKNKSLDVHHKKPWRFTKNDNSDNLISLCRKCHREEDVKIQKILIAKKVKEGRKIKVVYKDALI